MAPSLDPTSPVPLYHQLAEALRYRIATGALAPGTVLPSLRDAARQWRVNLHTVRHAYAALAAEGLVRTEVPRGTVILGDLRPAGRGTSATPVALNRFLTRMLREAKTHFGLAPHQLGRSIARLAGSPATFLTGAGPAGVVRVPQSEPAHVVECSETQAADLAHQVSGAWEVPAHGWSLERPGQPPTGPVVATYFHYNDVRTRWPERFPAVHFVAIHPDPDLPSRLARFRHRGRRTRVLVVERTAAMAANIAADLRALLPDRLFSLTPVVAARAGAAFAGAPADTPMLFSPRMWGALTPAERADRRAIEIRYLIESKDLAALGQELEWTARPAAPASRARSTPAPRRRSRPASSA